MARGGRSAPILTRLAIGQMAGVMIGIIAFAMLPLFLPELDARIRWGIFLWYPTLGAVVALLDIVNGEESVPVALPWWLRGALVGAWMNLVATLLIFEVMREFLLSVSGPDAIFTSPFWFVAEGAFAGLLIGYLVMRFGGEGRGIADD